MNMYYKKLAFPKVETFAELFGNIEPKQDRDFADKSVISNWLHYSPKFKSEYREPLPMTLKYVRENMLPVDYDSIYFQLVDRGDNETLVTAQYNQILGNRWLAMIQTDSIPISY